MTARKRPAQQPKTRNPFYKGATPEQVARALLRHRPKDEKRRQPKRAG